MTTELLPGESFNDWARRVHNIQLLTRVYAGGEHLFDIENTATLDFVQIMLDIDAGRMDCNERYLTKHKKLEALIFNEWSKLTSGEMISFVDLDLYSSKFYVWGKGWTDQYGEPLAKATT